MGDRASISFKNGKDESPVLCSHWGGRAFQEQALRYVKRLKVKFADKHMYPLQRFEVGTLMVDFIRELTQGMEEVDSDLYLGKTTDEVDNSDNGHLTIDVSDEVVKVAKVRGEFEPEEGFLGREQQFEEQ